MSVQKYHREDTIGKRLKFYNEENALASPEEIDITIKDPLGEIADTLDKEDLIEENEGIFKMVWSIPDDAAYGPWLILVQGTSAAGTVKNTEAFTFQVCQLRAGYCTLTDVRKRLKLKDDDTSKDAEIADAIEEAQGMIDDELNAYTSTPLTTVSNTIRYATADLTAHIIITRNPQKGEGEAEDKRFWMLYREKMDLSIETAYKRGRIV